MGWYDGSKKKFIIISHHFFPYPRNHSLLIFFERNWGKLGKNLFALERKEFIIISQN